MGRNWCGDAAKVIPDRFGKFYFCIKNENLCNNPPITQGFDNFESSSDIEEIVECEVSDLRGCKGDGKKAIL